jgi:hypothetical protein
MAGEKEETMTEVAHANRSRGEGVGKRGRISATLLAMLAALSGCIFQQEPKVVQGEPYPDPGGKTHVDRRDVGGAKTETALSANALDVTMTQPSECRDETPMVRDVTTERQANTMWQVVNGGGAILFGGLGAYALAGDCTVTPDPTASNQNPASRPCTGKEEGQATALGVGLVATGALFGAAFIYNVIKARDSKETAPVRVARDWKTCGTRPVAGTSLRLDLADGQQIVQSTNAQGQAHFDLTGVRWTDGAFKSPQARLASSGQQLASVDLSKLPQYAEWQRKQQEQAKAQDAQQQREVAERTHAANLITIQEVERDIKKLTPKRIDAAQIALFQGLIDKLKQAAQRPGSSEDDKSKLLALSERLGAFAPAYDKVIEAAVAADDQAYISNGWAAMKTRLVAPATASLVSNRILLRCPKGRIILYEFDSQTRMGGFIRGKGAVKINADTGFVAYLEEERIDTGSVPLFPMGALLQAAQKGDCSQMQ